MYHFIAARIYLGFDQISGVKVIVIQELSTERISPEVEKILLAEDVLNHMRMLKYSRNRESKTSNKIHSYQYSNDSTDPPSSSKSPKPHS